MAPDFGALLWPIATVVSLLVVLTLVGRYRQRRGPAAFDQSQIRLLATKRLGLQSSLILIEVDGQRFLLAATRAHRATDAASCSGRLAVSRFG
jgi:flagellar biogenesis protein FliO